MKRLRLVSWNVNGLRAVLNKGFLDWLTTTRPDILCLQEIKARPDQLPESLTRYPGYTFHWHPATRPGYSGVAIFSRQQPKKIATTFGSSLPNDEGRIIRADYDTFSLYNVYFPNGGQGPHRLEYKMRFYDAFLAHLKKTLRTQKNIIICGDVNTAHERIDLARPDENAKTTGFLPEERAWIDRLVKAGFIDTYRHFHKGGDAYSYWDYMTRARDRNVGWRIDYFYVSKAFLPHLKAAAIHPDVMGSDHCPVSIEISA